MPKRRRKTKTTRARVLKLERRKISVDGLLTSFMCPGNQIESALNIRAAWPVKLSLIILDFFPESKTMLCVVRQRTAGLWKEAGLSKGLSGKGLHMTVFCSELCVSGDSTLEGRLNGFSLSVMERAFSASSWARLANRRAKEKS